MRNSIPSPSFCVLPWGHRFTNIQGQIQVCCSSEEFKNDILGNDDRPLNFRDGLSDQEIMNTAYMKDLRLDMLKGKWNPICQRCFLTEETGGNSRRIGENLRFDHLIPGLLGKTAGDGSIESEIFSVDLRLGNRCNLTCLMCSPTSSHLWTKDFNRLRPGRYHFDQEDLKRVGDISWTDSESLISNLVTQAPFIEHLHFAGGEPLIHAKMLEILQVMVDSGHSSHIKLTYNSNVTVIPPLVKKLWPKFKGTELFCSVDAIGELNSYIRHPSRWNVIHRNLTEIDRNFREWNLTNVILSTTVSIHNVLKLDQIFYYLRENFTSIQPFPNLVPLYFPFYLDIRILPKALKELAEERLIQLKADLQASCPPNDWRDSSLNSIINFLRMDVERKGHLLRQFQTFTQKCDSFFGINLLQNVPELSIIFDKDY